MPYPLPGIDDYPERYQYRFCPMDATPLARKQGRDMERLRCPVCGWTFYPVQNQAATVLVEYQGGIVLARRALPPDVGIWHFPIGHVEFGESPEETAVRETYEETGLEIDTPRFVVYDHGRGYEDRRLWYVVFGFVARATGGQLTTSDETAELKVVALEDMPPLKWTSQQKTLAAYRALQGAE